MNTIKTISITVITIGALALSACDKFLDARPEGTTEAAGFDYAKFDNAFMPVSAAYASLRSGSVHGFSYVGMFEIAADNADKGSTPEDNPPMREIDEFGYSPDNGLINDIWEGYFNVVSAANFAIAEMPEFEKNASNNDNINKIREYRAEAKVIRAYAYFNLTRMFGRVPIIDTIHTSEELANMEQASTAELYAFIEKDLQEAIGVLPIVNNKDGRINKFTALAIKAKVHLYQKEWSEVVACAGQVIASGEYKLMDNFRDEFRSIGENSSESLFEIGCSTFGKTTGEAAFIEGYAFAQGPRNNSPGNMQGWGFSTPSADLISFFDGRGEKIRKEVTIMQRGTKFEQDDISPNCSNEFYNGKVYTPSSQNKWSYNGYSFDYNVRVLRYADVLLMYAEALLEGQGSTDPVVASDATEALNKVRRRAQLDTISSTDISVKIVLDERRAELAMEQDRFFDLVRTGKAAEVLKSNGFVAGKHELYPIPAPQMQLNSKLTKNPGY